MRSAFGLTAMAFSLAITVGQRHNSQPTAVSASCRVNSKSNPRHPRQRQVPRICSGDWDGIRTDLGISASTSAWTTQPRPPGMGPAACAVASTTPTRSAPGSMRIGKTCGCPRLLNPHGGGQSRRPRCCTDPPLLLARVRSPQADPRPQPEASRAVQTPRRASSSYSEAALRGYQRAGL
jgi:hypothetical protein